MERSYANVHRGLHTLANETTDAYEAARDKRRRASSTPTPAEIVFTKGGTEAINLVAAGIGASLQAGDEIVLSRDGAPRQHRALALPARAQGRGAEVRSRSPTTARLDLEAYAGAARPEDQGRGASATCPTCWAPSTRSPRPSRGWRTRPARWCCSTAARRIVHKPVDVQALDADFYVFSGHKLYGPTGIGVLYGKAERAGRAAALPGRRRDDRHGHAGARSPTPTRRTASRPARRRSSRRSAWARRSTGSAGLDRAAVAEHEQRLYARVRERPARAPTGCRCSARRRARARSWPSPSRARTPTTWPRSSTATAWPCAPAPIAPSR